MHSYLELSNPLEEDIDSLTIQFSLPNNWLQAQELHPEDIALYRFTSRSWEQQKTNLISQRGLGFVFESTTSSSDYFAISAPSLPQLLPPEPGTLSEALLLSGIIYDKSGNQVPNGTQLALTNVITGATIYSYTGIGQDSGGYHAVLNSNKGDLIHITAMAPGQPSSTVLILEQDSYGVDFVLGEDGVLSKTRPKARLTPASPSQEALSLFMYVGFVVIFLFSLNLYQRRSIKKNTKKGKGIKRQKPKI